MRPDPIQDWLRLEAFTGADEPADELANRRAEDAFARALALLPLLAPSAGFSSRVSARLTELGAGARPPRLLASWAARAATAWVAIQAAVLVAIGTAVVGGLAAALGPVRLVGGLVTGAALTADRLLEGLRVGVAIAELSQSSLLAAGPTLLVSLVLCIAASVVGVALLAPLYAPPEGSRGAAS